jgi:hypothetical protein
VPTQKGHPKGWGWHKFGTKVQRIIDKKANKSQKNMPKSGLFQNS